MLQHFQFNWETIGYKGNSAIGEIKRWDCFNDSPAREVRSTVNWVSLHSDLVMTVRTEWFYCSQSSSFQWNPIPVGYIYGGIQLPALRQFQYHRLILSFSFFFSGQQRCRSFACFQRECGSKWCTFFSRQPQPVIPNTLAWWTRSSSQAASCTSSCCNKCTVVLWNADFGSGSQSALLCTLIPLPAEVSVCAEEVQSSSDASQNILQHFLLLLCSQVKDGLVHRVHKVSETLLTGQFSVL